MIKTKKMAHASAAHSTSKRNDQSIEQSYTFGLAGGRVSTPEKTTMAECSEEVIPKIERWLRAAIRGTDMNPDLVGVEHHRGAVVGYRAALECISRCGLKGGDAINAIQRLAEHEAVHYSNTRLEYHRGCWDALTSTARDVARLTSEDLGQRSESHE